MNVEDVIFSAEKPGRYVFHADGIHKLRTIEGCVITFDDGYKQPLAPRGTHFVSARKDEAISIAGKSGTLTIVHGAPT